MKRPQLAVACLLLTACATQPPPPPLPAGNWAERAARLLALTHWQLDGRMLLQARGEGVSGSVRWEQAGSQVDFQFRGPLGAGTLLIDGGPGAWRVRTSRGEEWIVSDPEAELGELLGWDLPLASLRYWVVGVPDPQQAVERNLDDRQRLATLQQGPWRVVYTAYRRVGALELPRKLEVTGPDLRLRMVVKDWDLASVDGPTAAD